MGFKMSSNKAQAQFKAEQDKINESNKPSGQAINENLPLRPISYLEALINQFLVQHNNNNNLSMAEVVGLFELKVVEFKESWRLQTEANMRMAQAEVEKSIAQQQQQGGLNS
jgi:hypothetical protein